MGIIQIDSVNVLVRSQELPLFARLGPHPRNLIPAAANDGELFEYWVHAASLMPSEQHHLMRWKMAREHMWGGCRDLMERRPDYIDEVLRRIEVDGAIAAGDISERVGPKGQWWDWDDAKVALEVLFWNGQVSATRRAADFARVYDLTERVLPRHVLDRATPTEHDAQKELLARAARHHGVGTVADLADYHRQNLTLCKRLIRELVEEGVVEEVRVEGWAEAAYLHADAVVPRSLHATALLSPFDPVCWFRDRGERLFDFHYRIEIYTPAPKRVYGYYVLPILWGDTLAGRIDLKADRAAGSLLVQGAYTEAGVSPRAMAPDVAGELSAMAEWLGLDRVVVADRGDLATPLRRAVGAPSVRSH